MKEELQELYKYRELLYTIAHRDIKVRYKQSIMGFMWAIFMPILIVMSGVVVRYAYALASHVPLQTADIASVAVKSLPWAFLVSSIRFACNSLTQQQQLGDQGLFPKGDLSLGGRAGQPFRFSGGIGSSGDLSVRGQDRLELYLIWTPLLLLNMVVLAAGIGMVVSAASLFFRDVKYIVEVLLTFGIFFTPVFYDVYMFGDKGKWLLLNPVAPILEGLSACIVHHPVRICVGLPTASVSPR